ncbi:clathrin heavy chain [Wallemia mellicola]|nr:clathrin heavy chain [Wallemia mellicola]
MSSDKFICVREGDGGATPKQVVIVDLNDLNNVMRRPISADSAIMHPDRKLIALKAGKQLQLFNLELKQKVKSHLATDDIVYWSWLNESTLGLVSDTSVYHWDIDAVGENSPVKVFDRHANLTGSQIINYRATDDGKWMALIGISSNPSPDGFRIKGAMQLYSRDRGVSQPIEGHTAAFSELKLDGNATPSKLFAFAVRTGAGAKLHIVEIDYQSGQTPYTKKAIDVFFPAEAATDFPVAMQISKKYGIIYLITKFGFVHLYDLESGTCIYMNRISGDTVFVTAEHESTSGLIGVNRKGQVLSVSIDENTVIPYILSTLNNVELAFKLASRGNLPGADDLYMAQYQNLMSNQQFNEAAKIAANSPRSILRTQQTIEQFKSLPAVPGQLSPILQYFGILLEKGELNKFESLELSRPVLQQGRKQLLEKWLKENKLECSEELGDIVRLHDMTLALSIYLRANVPNKVVACFAETGQFNKIIVYAQKVNYTPDYALLMQHIVRVNPDQAAEFASQIVNDPEGPKIDIERVVDVFLGQNLIQQATSFLLDALKENKPEQGHLQTRLLEINLINAPQVADAILGNAMFTHFDHPRVANLCEKAGLLQRALELYQDTNDLKRVVVHTPLLNPEWLVNYFGQLTVDQTFACLNEMLKVNIRQTLPMVVQIATKYSELLGSHKLIELFESFKTFEGLYYFLGSVVNLSEDSEVHFKYIQAATRTGQIREVERIVRESNHYNPEKVKNFLKEVKLPDQLPLIIVCDRFDFVHDLVLYLFQNGLTQFISTYVQQVNSARLPQVVGGLLDVDCDEQTIKNLLSSVHGLFDVNELVDEVEKRNRLKLILPWLESRINAGQQDAAIYNALAKIYIDSNNNPEQFLKENNIYEPLVVGKYCEKRDPYLAFIAFAKGFCDDELIYITNENGMYKHQARYLVKRRDLDLWAQVLTDSNEHRRLLIDQVSAVAIPESQNPDDVSVAVKAFMTAGLQQELVDILEKIILNPTTFSDNGSLQNLLLLTAIRSDQGRVMNYINKLDKYDFNEIAKIAIDNDLHEEAFTIYKKNDAHFDALVVLVEHIVSIDRAYDYTNKVNEPALWARLAKAQLDGLRITDAIESYIKANDPSNFTEVIEISERAEKHEDLVRYLQMARNTAREPKIDSTLVYCLCKTDRLQDAEDFLHMTNVADVLEVGEKCFNDGLYLAAKVLFTSISNYARLATTLIYLEDNQAAVECARKAGNTQVWKQVCLACVDKQDYKLARICGLNLIVHPEELQAIISLYESRGLFQEMLDLFEAGLGLERAHMGLFTETAIAYAKYQPERMFEHLKLYGSRLNIPKVIKSAKEGHLWRELVYLYIAYAEWDNAALNTIEHSADAWDHQQFRDVLSKVANAEIFYKALSFYQEQHPTLLTDLLTALIPRIDHSRVVSMFRHSDNLPLVRAYLIAVQNLDVAAVNEAVHDLLIEEEDWQTLLDVIDQYQNFDHLSLAKRLEQHELLAFRRIAAHLFKVNRKYEDSINLSKSDKLYIDAIITASTSEDVQVSEDLLSYWVDIGNKELFTAHLYLCFKLVRPDVVEELAWFNALEDFAKPYQFELRRQTQERIKALEKKVEEQANKTAKKEEDEDSQPIMGPGFNQTLMIGGPAGWNAGTNGVMPQQTGVMPQATGVMPQMTGLQGGVSDLMDRWIADKTEGWIGAEVTAHSGDEITFKDERGTEIIKKSSANDLPLLRNPILLEGTDDLVNLSYLNEPAVLYSIKRRYAQHSIYTYSGIVLIAVNPFAKLSIYGPAIMQAYSTRRRGELEPHIYAIAQDAHASMTRENKNQTMVVSGESGAGKTVSARHIMQYLAFLGQDGTGSASTGTDASILATNPVMEAFGNAKTIRNNNSSRFGRYLKILFDKQCNIIGAQTSIYLLERSRLIFQPEGERNYHIFHQLCAGVPPKERAELHLGSSNDFHYLNQGGSASIPGIDDGAEFEVTQKALSTLGIGVEKQWNIFKLLASLLHLGNVKIGQTRNDAVLNEDDEAFKIATEFLGINPSDFKKWTVKKQITTRGESIVSSLNAAQASVVRDSVAKYIYACLFDWLVAVLNEALYKESDASKFNSFIGVLDIYGFEHFKRNSFEQFCINYANEKLQQEFNAHVFKLEQDEYIKEQIRWEFISFSDNRPTIDMIEGKLGILSLLDEESRMPSGTDQNFLEKLHSQLGKPQYKDIYKKPRFGNTAFTVAHYAHDVAYEAEGFLEKNRDTVPDEHLQLLGSSSNSFLREVIEIAVASNAAATPASSTASNNVGVGRRQNLKKPTLGSIFKGSLISLMDTINDTNAHYIRCIKPNEQKKAWDIDSQQVLSQLRACGVLETIKISSAGYPTRWSFAEFTDRYYPLVGSEHWLGDMKELCLQILQVNISDEDKYQIGLSKIFFRAGMLAYLEKLRADRLNTLVTLIQKNILRYLHVKHYKKLREATVSIQTWWRKILAIRYVENLRRDTIIFRLQSAGRRKLAVAKFQNIRRSVIMTQAQIRGMQARVGFADFKYRSSALNLQRIARGVLARRQHETSLRGVIHLQACYRRRLARKEFKQLKSEARSVAHIQEVSYKLENKVVELTQNLQKTREEKKELTRRCNQLEKQMGNMQTRHDDADQRMKEMMVELAKPTVALTDFNELEALKRDLQTQVSTLKIDIQERDKQIQQHKDELGTQAQEIESKSAQAAEASARAADETLVNQLKAEIGSLKDQLHRANTLNALEHGSTKAKQITAPTFSMHLGKSNENVAALVNGAGSPVEGDASDALEALGLPPNKRRQRRHSANGAFLEQNGLGRDTSDEAFAAGKRSEAAPRAVSLAYPTTDNASKLRGLNGRAYFPEVLDDPSEEMIKLLEDEQSIDDDILTTMIHELKAPPPSLQNPPSAKEVLFPAHIMSLVTNEMWKYCLIMESERLLANVMQTIQQHVMSFQGEDAIVPGLFWLSNVHEVWSFVCVTEDDMLQGIVPGGDDPDRPLDWPAYEQLITVVKHDLESLEYNIYFAFMEETKKKLRKMIVPALIESQSLPGFITSDTGGRLFNRLLQGNSQPAYNMDDILNLLNKVWKCLKSYRLDEPVVLQVMTELLRLIGNVGFNDLLMRRNFNSWKRAMQIQYNLTRLEEWCKSHDLPEGCLHLEYMMQATKLLQLKKATTQDMEIIFDVCWILSPSQLHKLITGYMIADYESPLSPHVLQTVSARLSSDRNDHLLLAEEEGSNFELPQPRQVIGLDLYIPGTVSVPHLRRIAGLAA